MGTAAVFTDVKRKRILGTEDFQERLIAYMRTLVQESLQRSFPSGAAHEAQIDLSAGGNDEVTVGTGTGKATDGLGHVFDLSGSSYLTAQFENSAAVPYYVLLHEAEIPDGVQINPRSGLPEWIGTREEIGLAADPDAVAITGGGTTLEFTVDSVTEAGVSNAGRTVAVWKLEPGPNATTEAVAVQYLTVTWDGSNNKVTAADLMGQTTPSTTAADYQVCLMGPMIKRNGTWDQNTADHFFVGEVTGVGAGSPPAVFDMSGQRVAVATLDDLEDITSRHPTTDRLKIDVKAYTGDETDEQIAVRDTGGAIVFSVDGSGNMIVQGTQTIYDTVTVYSSQTITDNLEAGDATGDTHTIKGTWRHTDPAETENYFRVDGTTGHVGINTLPDATAVLKVQGDTVARHIVPETTGNYDLGASGVEWRTFYVQTLTLSGDLDPSSDGGPDIGDRTLRWNEIFGQYGIFNNTGVGYSALSRTMGGIELSSAGMDTTSKYTTAVKFMSTDSQLATENPKLLAAIAGRATESYAVDTDGGMAIDFAVTADNPGASSVPTLALTLEPTVLRPYTDEQLGLGLESQRWGTSYISALAIGDGAIAGDLSIRKSVGDAVLRIEADTDNDNEDDNPYIYLLQDGATVNAQIGFCASAGDSPSGGVYTDTLENSFLIAQTGNNYPVQIGTNGAVRVTVAASTGYVGIGTNTPSTRLHVEGTHSLDNGHLKISGTGHASGFAGLTFYNEFAGTKTSGTRNWRIMQNRTTVGTLEFAVSTGEDNAPEPGIGIGYFSTTGFGIGTVPATRFHVHGDADPVIRITSADPLEGAGGTENIAAFEFEGQQNDLYRVGGYMRARQSGTWSTATSNIAPTAISFHTQDASTSDTRAAERLTIGPTGYIGINNAAPGLYLDVIGPDGIAEGTPAWDADDIATFRNNGASGNACGIAIIGGTAATSSLYFGDKDDRDIGAVTYDHSADQMIFRTAAGNQVFISNTGSVGIGSAAFGATLDVAGDIAASTGFTGRSTTAGITVAGGPAISDGSRISLYGSAHATVAGDAYYLANEHVFRTLAASPLLFIEDTTGYVGVGTESPTTKLHVAGDVTATGSYKATTSKILSTFMTDAVVRQLNGGVPTEWDINAEDLTLMSFYDSGGTCVARKALNLPISGTITAARVRLRGTSTHSVRVTLYRQPRTANIGAAATLMASYDSTSVDLTASAGTFVTLTVSSGAFSADETVIITIYNRTTSSLDVGVVELTVTPDDVTAVTL